MTRIVGVTIAIMAVLAGLYWFAGIIRKADRAEIVNQTVKETQKRDNDDAAFKKLDMAGICRELDLDLLPDGTGCQ